MLILQQLILFDSDCLFCQSSVFWIIKRDPANRFVFSSLTSELGKQLLAHPSIPTNIDSIVVFTPHAVLLESDAALHIAKQLDSPVRFLAIFQHFPKNWRDEIYRFIARRRKQILGKTTCRLPSPEEQKRFITKWERS